MFAIVELNGHQYKIKIGDKIIVDRIDEKVGEKVSPEKVLLFKEDDNSDLEIGKPFLDKNIEFKIIEHFRGDKVTVFKMKSKKRYRRTRGFRARLTKLEVLGVLG